MKFTNELLHYILNKYWDVRTSNKENLFDLNKPIDVEDIREVFQVKHVQVAIGNYNGVDVIYILGSNEFKDWLYNLSFPFMKTPYKEAGTNKKIKMHSGFYKSYKLIRNEIHNRIKDKSDIIVMGHSFGAAVATIAALDLQYNFPDKSISCIITGSPRVGNKVLMKSFNKRVPNTIRIVYRNDLVTRIPFRIMGFRHVGELKQLSIRTLWVSVKDHLYPHGYLKEL